MTEPRQRKNPLLSNLNRNWDTMIDHNLPPLHPPEILTVSHRKASGYMGPTYSTSLGPPAPLRPHWTTITDHHQEDPPAMIALATTDPPEEDHQEDRPQEEALDPLHQTIEDDIHHPQAHQDCQADHRYWKGLIQMYTPHARSTPIRFILIASIS